MCVFTLSKHTSTPTLGIETLTIPKACLRMESVGIIGKLVDDTVERQGTTYHKVSTGR